MNKLFAFIILATSLAAMDITVLDEQPQSMTIEIAIDSPELYEYKIGGESIQLPRWADANFSYDPEQAKIFPVFTIPILLPPDRSLPEVEILYAHSSQDHRLSRQIRSNVLHEDMELPIVQSSQIIDVIPAEDFRAFNTARILIMPYAEPGQRLENMTFRLTFSENLNKGHRQDTELISTYLNSLMASNWAKISPKSLKRIVNSLPTGQWYRLPISEMGIQRINANSFPGTIPDSNPLSWQVFAPFYEGQSLPFALSNTEPNPENLKAISMKTQGLEDGVLSGDDEILFFAQPLNGNFKSNSFTHLYGNQRYYWLCIPVQDTQTANNVSLL